MQMNEISNAINSDPKKQGLYGISASIFGMILCVGLLMAMTVTPMRAAGAQETKLVVQGSGLPVPRFVTLKSDTVNMRVGPGREYPLS